MFVSRYPEVRTAVAVLASLSAIVWASVIWAIVNMDTAFVQMMMPMSDAWTLNEALAVWIMWAVMMGAMMLPSAVPMLLAHRRVVTKRGTGRDSVVFALAYLFVWTVFSAAAAWMQWEMQRHGVLSRMLVVNVVWVSGLLLILAGIVQWTPLKQACLRMCRTPIGFLATEWRPGTQGAFIMGLRHGTFCLGCCWALMALLFVFGVMNLVAITALATVVAAEKLLPFGEVAGKIGGIALIVWGVCFFVF